MRPVGPATDATCDRRSSSTPRPCPIPAPPRHCRRDRRSARPPTPHVTGARPRPPSLPHPPPRHCRRGRRLAPTTDATCDRRSSSLPVPAPSSPPALPPGPAVELGAGRPARHPSPPSPAPRSRASGSVDSTCGRVAAATMFRRHARLAGLAPNRCRSAPARFHICLILRRFRIRPGDGMAHAPSGPRTSPSRSPAASHR